MENLDPCVALVDSIRCTAADDKVVVHLQIPGDSPGEYTRISVHVNKGLGEFLYAFGDVFQNDVFQGYSAYKSGGNDTSTRFPMYMH